MVPRAILGLCLCFCALALAAAPVPDVPVPDVPVSGTPSIVAGRDSFRSACAVCHGGGLEFSERAWRVDLSPADVVRLVVPRVVLDAAVDVPTAETVGPTDGVPDPTTPHPPPHPPPHPTPFSDLEAGWAVTGYLWSLATTGPEVRRGETLAFEAAAALEKDALNVALFHREQLRQLKSATWVLNHRQDDVIDLMSRLAGRRFRALEPSDQAALTEYITLSYFAWPPEW